MDIIQAMEERHSVRQYKTDRIPEDIITRLNGEIDRINAESGLSVRLVLDEPTAFRSMMTRMTGFKNAVNYFAMIGPDDDSLYYKAGYYGEQLVLLAQQLGLNTCWAMLCGKKACRKDMNDGMRMAIGIAVGYGETQGVPHKDRPVEQVADLKDAPDWFIQGVRCAMLAPTGMNKQAFRIEREGNKVRITGGSSSLAKIDLGIVRYHFETGAGDAFEWM